MRRPNDHHVNRYVVAFAVPALVRPAMHRGQRAVHAVRTRRSGRRRRRYHRTTCLARPPVLLGATAVGLTLVRPARRDVVFFTRTTAEAAECFVHLRLGKRWQPLVLAIPRERQLQKLSAPCRRARKSKRTDRKRLGDGDEGHQATALQPADRNQRECRTEIGARLGNCGDSV